MSGILADIRSSALLRIKKLFGGRSMSFLRKCLHRNVPDLNEYRNLLSGKKALEIGGPSGLFSDSGCLPIYSVFASADNCLFSDRTIWTGEVADGRTFRYHPAKSPGLQLFFDGTDLQQIPNSNYQVILASHCLEHIANPLRALYEWKRVLTLDGLLLLILPHKDGTFDWRRPTTQLDHMIHDHETNVSEDDLTHVSEIFELHDLKKDPGAGSVEQFKQRCLDNKHARAMHHHVFETSSAAALVDHAGFQLVRVAAVKPFHIIILAARCNGQKNNSSFLRPDAAFRTKSPFPSDRQSSASKGLPR
jgi:SAM-dependent methyltransferase